MTDRKRDALKGEEPGRNFADLTVPVPVRVEDSKPATDEADAETFIGMSPEEVSRRPVTGDDDTVQRSFDDDVAKQRVPARPARTERPAAKPAPVDVDFPAAGDTNQFMQAVFANACEAARGRTTRPDRVSTKKIVEPVELSSEDRAEPDEPTVQRAPDLTPDEKTEAAPVANPADADSVPTAPIPMMSGLTREMLRDDEPSLPRMRPPPEVRVNGVGDGIEREEPSAPTTTPEPPVDHTPLYRPVATSTELVGRVERDEKDITAPDLELPAKKSRASLFVIGAVAGLALAALVIVAAVLLSRAGGGAGAVAPKGDTRAPVVAAETKASATTTTSPNASATKASAPSTKESDADAKDSATTASASSSATKESATKESATKESATPPESAAATKAGAASTNEGATATPPSSASPANESASTPPRSALASSTSVSVARRPDGFGPFVDHTGLGLGGALGAAARSIVGSLDGTEIGVRGEVLHVETSKKDKTTAVECAFTVFDKTGGRGRMGATAKGARASEAAQACAQSLAPDLKAAVARVRGP